MEMYHVILLRLTLGVILFFRNISFLSLSEMQQLMNINSVLQTPVVVTDGVTPLMQFIPIGRCTYVFLL